MKKYDSIMRRVVEVEEKAGIVYARPDGALYRGLRTCFTLAYFYKLFMNLIYVGGSIFMHYDSETFVMATETVITVSICTAVMIIGWVLLYTKLKIIANFVSIVALPVQLTAFAGVMRDSLGQIRSQYYWMHLVPIIIMLLFAVWMLVIIFRARYLTNAQYKRIVGNLYDTYHEKISGDNPDGISDELWEDFLKNYDAHGYNQQFEGKKKE